MSKGGGGGGAGGGGEGERVGGEIDEVAAEGRGGGGGGKISRDNERRRRGELLVLERGKRKTRLDPAEFSETGKQRGVKKNIKKIRGQRRQTESFCTPADGFLSW